MQTKPHGDTHHARNGEVQVQLETLSFDRTTSHACQSALTTALHRVDWSWHGSCETCRQDYSEAESCRHSRPTGIAGIPLRNDYALVRMMEDLGGASMLFYLKQIDHTRGHKEKCPRCQAIDEWAQEWQENLEKRLQHVVEGLVCGQVKTDACLTEIPIHHSNRHTEVKDVLFSNRFRSIVHHLQKHLGPHSPGSTVAIMVPATLISYMLWKMLWFIQPAWQNGQRPQLSKDQFFQKMCHQNGRERRACAWYHPDIMTRKELSDIEEDIRNLQVLVVVVCTESRSEIESTAFAGCNMLFWDDRICQSAFKLVGRNSRLTLMYEKCEKHRFAATWEREPHESSNVQRREEKAHKSEMDHCTAGHHTSDTNTVTTQQSIRLANDALEELYNTRHYEELVFLVRELWLQYAPDSYTIAAFRQQAVNEQTDIFRVEINALKGYQASVRSPGQLSSPDPHLYSAWETTLETAKRSALSKALKRFETFDMLNVKNKTVSATNAFSSGANTGEQVNTDCAIHSSERSPETERFENHEGQNLAEVIRGNTVNLSDPMIVWPQDLHLVRLEAMLEMDGELSPAEYGLIVVPLPEESTYFFGLSLEWYKGSEMTQVVRFDTTRIDWEYQRSHYFQEYDEDSTPEDPNELVRKYHEAVINKLYPETMPNIAQMIERTPTSALLVKLKPNFAFGSRKCLDWSEMKAVVDDHNKKCASLLVESSIDDCMDDETSSTQLQKTVLKQEQPHEMSKAMTSSDQINDMKDANTADSPAWLKELLRRDGFGNDSTGD